MVNATRLKDYAAALSGITHTVAKVYGSKIIVACGGQMSIIYLEESDDAIKQSKSWSRGFVQTFILKDEAKRQSFINHLWKDSSSISERLKELQKSVQASAEKNLESKKKLEVVDSKKKTS